ncbi:uncharacterized protein LOC125013013 [Mugil cephalus]|uniref:uncharacterized protein LOC125013013 n=1 Tax=Mugil cephalus TaxID=48193 RepID=UPI001FB58C9C|nr:uncharacterized protein LOC125013013 [Mugil cephalus]
MASTNNLQNSLSPWCYSLQLALFFTMTWLFSVTDSQIQLRGELGGNVTFHCPVNNKPLNFLYLQRGNNFVNGYYAERNITQTWENTKVDRKEAAVHMFGLNISHNGQYSCHFRYHGNDQVTDANIHLRVTARYSKPVVTGICDDNNHSQSCMVTCTSHGGYPRSQVTWYEPSGNTSSQMWKVLNNSEVPSPVSLVYNSSSTVLVNCSSGSLTFTCSVGDVTSDRLSVCAPPAPNDNNLILHVACGMVFVIGVMTLLICVWKRRKGRPVQDDVRMEATSIEVERMINLKS